MGYINSLHRGLTNINVTPVQKKHFISELFIPEREYLMIIQG